MYKIDITKSAGKSIKILPPKQYRQVIGTILALREDPTPNDSKKLSGYPEYLREVRAPGLAVVPVLVWAK